MKQVLLFVSAGLLAIMAGGVAVMLYQAALNALAWFAR